MPSPPRFGLAGVSVFTGRGRQRVPILEQITLDIPASGVTAVVGTSGAGKTTLARLLCGRIGWDEGDIVYCGRPVAHWPSGTLARTNPLICQDPFAAVNPCWPLGKTVAEPLRLSGHSADEANHRALEMLAHLGLSPDLGQRLPHQVSGGELQRVVLARALVARPAYLVFDEPFARLDPPLVTRLIDDLARLLAERSIGALLIAHELESVRRLSFRSVVLEGGRLVFTGTTADLLAGPFASGLTGSLRPQNRLW